jgi:hypothetical protein
VVVLQKRRIAAPDARGLAMIVDPDLDEAYFIGNEEDNVAQDSESKWTLCFTEIYHLKRKSADYLYEILWPSATVREGGRDF